MIEDRFNGMENALALLLWRKDAAATDRYEKSWELESEDVKSYFLEAARRRLAAPSQ